MAINKQELKTIKGYISDSQNELALIVSRAFEAQNKKFTEIDKHFEKIENTLADHGELLHRLDSRSHDERRITDNHEKRIRKLEAHPSLT